MRLAEIDKDRGKGEGEEEPFFLPSPWRGEAEEKRIARIAQRYSPSVAPCQTNSASQYGIVANRAARPRKNGG